MLDMRLLVYALKTWIQMIHVDLLNSVQTQHIISSPITNTINSRHTHIGMPHQVLVPFDVNRSYFRLNLKRIKHCLVCVISKRWIFGSFYMFQNKKNCNGALKTLNIKRFLIPRSISEVSLDCKEKDRIHKM